MNQERKRQWTAPPRPDWLARINEEGRCMDIRGVVPLTEDSLIDAAKASTGLDDFGADDWYEPFKHLVQSLDEEAELHLMGRIMARSDVLIYLEARLQIEDWYKRHPEIDDEEIKQPIIILGQGRSGTSALLNLLAKDPENGVCKTWEAYFPCPPPEQALYLTDPRIARADKLITQWYRVGPGLDAQHEFSGEIPTEIIQAHCISFRSPAWYNMIGQVPGYNAYMATQGWRQALEYEKRTLKLLQWRNPRKHWVMKSPEATRYLKDAIAVYPDVQFVWSHRDPVKALASTVNLLGILTWMRSDRPLMPGAFEHVTSAERSNVMLCEPIALIESDPDIKARLCNVQYQDFLHRPLDVAEKIYAHCGRTLSKEARAAMDRYMTEYPRTTRPAHRYTIGSAKMVAHERQIFQRYQEYFGVPDEV